MTEKNRRLLILLPWLALPLLVGCYAVLWSRLPAELAVQFNMSGEVSNSLSRTYALLLNCALLLFILVRFTLRLWGADGRSLRADLVKYYLTVAFITTLFLLLLKFNL